MISSLLTYNRLTYHEKDARPETNTIYEDYKFGFCNLKKIFNYSSIGAERKIQNFVN